MSEASASTGGSLSDWNEDGRLFFVVGIVTALAAWLFLPLAGLVSVYCGLGLWTRYDRTVAGVGIAGVGGLSVVMWIAVLVAVGL